MIADKTSPSVPEGLSENLANLIKQCLKWNPDDRPTAG